MTDWFARPVLHVTDVEASLRFYLDRLGFSSAWNYEEDGRVRVAQVERQGCVLILSSQWPQKVGKGLMFISLNVQPETHAAQIAALDALRVELEAKGVLVSEGSWGYRLLVVRDPDGNELFFNYPSADASGDTGRQPGIASDDAKQAIAEGRQARNHGNFAAARGHYAVAANIHRERNDLLAYAHAIRHIADIYQQESNSDGAKPLYEECLELYRANLGTKVLDLANALRPYALLNEDLGNLELARELWVEAKVLYGALRLDVGISECDAHLSKLQAV